jgi:hypothetical protein
MLRNDFTSANCFPAKHIFQAPSLEEEYDETEKISCWKDVRRFSLAEGRSPERGTLPSARVHCDASDIAGKRPSAIA